MSADSDAAEKELGKACDDGKGIFDKALGTTGEKEGFFDLSKI